MKSLGISDNKILLNKVEISRGKVLDAIKEFEVHPSVLRIKEHVTIDTEFSLSPVSLESVNKELKGLHTKKAFSIMNIPQKLSKESIGIIDKHIQGMWNNEILRNKKFPDKLKLADVTPIHKKLNSPKKELQAS